MTTLFCILMLASALVIAPSAYDEGHYDSIFAAYPDFSYWQLGTMLDIANETSYNDISAFFGTGLSSSYGLNKVMLLALYSFEYPTEYVEEYTTTQIIYSVDWKHGVFYYYSGGSSYIQSSSIKPQIVFRNWYTETGKLMRRLEIQFNFRAIMKTYITSDTRLTQFTKFCYRYDESYFEGVTNTADGFYLVDSYTQTEVQLYRFGSIPHKIGLLATEHWSSETFNAISELVNIVLYDSTQPNVKLNLESLQIVIDANHQYGYNQGHNEGLQIGYQDGYEDGWIVGDQEGNIAGYNSGYSVGYGDGYDDGYSIGNEEGYSDGYDYGFYDAEELHASDYMNGYGAGLLEVADTEESIKDVVFAIFDAPVNLINGILDFNLFGINVASLVKTLITLAITALLVFFILKLVKG